MFAPRYFYLLPLCALLAGCPEDKNIKNPIPNPDQSSDQPSDLQTMDMAGDMVVDMAPAQPTDMANDQQSVDQGQDMVDSNPDQPEEMSTEPAALLVGQGYMGRTVVSCDGGQSWVADQAFLTNGSSYGCGMMQNSARCYDDANGCAFVKDQEGTCEQQSRCDCDHSPGRPTGIAQDGQGVTVASFGWGVPGPIMRTTDGVQWQEVDKHRGNVGGLAYGDGVWMSFSRSPRISRDGGLTWQDAAMLDLQDTGGTIWNVRRAGYLAQKQGGAFIVFGQDGDKHDLQLSTDAGSTWRRPNMPGGCKTGVLGFNSNRDNLMLIITRDGNACVSEDGGQTFTAHSIGAQPRVEPVFAQGKFWTWDNSNAYTSNDGKTWTSTPLMPGNVRLGPVAYDVLHQRFAAVRGGWNQWYEQQRFYHSADGINWTELAEDKAPRGHMIRFISSATIPAGFTCP